MPLISSIYAKRSSMFSRRVRELGLQGGWIAAAKTFDAAVVDANGQRDMPLMTFTNDFPPSRDRALHDMLYRGMPSSCFESGFFSKVFCNVEAKASKPKGVLLLCEQIRLR